MKEQAFCDISEWIKTRSSFKKLMKTLAQISNIESKEVEEALIQKKLDRSNERRIITS